MEGMGSGQRTGPGKGRPAEGAWPKERGEGRYEPGDPAGRVRLEEREGVKGVWQGERLEPAEGARPEAGFAQGVWLREKAWPAQGLNPQKGYSAECTELEDSEWPVKVGPVGGAWPAEGL